PKMQQSIRDECPEQKVYFGRQALLALLDDADYDIGLNAIGGSAGIEATFAILQRGKQLALANKESLVMGGHLVQKLKKPGQILPVDSEHSAIFQALGKHPHHEVQKLIITASGGAFRTLPLQDFSRITPQMALKHPNWDMGAKVTLDSATMFNKALEVMEAHWLFDMPYERIEAVIHPQSIIHSLVQFRDGSMLAQISSPDMSLPILYALSYPERWQSELVQTNLLELPQLSFEDISAERYPLYYLGLEVAKQGGILPTVMNAAVEAAMKLFLEGKIPFTGIFPLVERTIAEAQQIPDPDLSSIVAANRNYYNRCLSIFAKQ
ncbi:MAG: 1-deoxy-D-xylulose-5-phosphate reductoisomerase, partial [Candidatus Cloacimonetes bacterium]|nr:1-deoxy-D-xylulose-5-phosphate reductoisomerase [Candidatus Cloacimonadota bacterium]